MARRVLYRKIPLIIQWSDGEKDVFYSIYGLVEILRRTGLAVDTVLLKTEKEEIHGADDAAMNKLRLRQLRLGEVKELRLFGQGMAHIATITKPVAILA